MTEDKDVKHEARNLLMHAAMHCKYGSDSTDRTPDEGDLMAHDILMNLRREFTWDASGKARRKTK